MKIKEKLINFLNKKNPVWLTIVIILIIILPVFFFYDKENFKRAGNVVHENNSNYKFTNPILDYEVELNNSSSIILYKQMEDHMASIKEKYALTHLSIYFRDLNNGEWVGLEEKEYFSPSSMLKTPVLVALFKYAQYDQSILDKVITLKEEDFQNVSLQYTPGEKVLLAGEQYTMLDLAKIMIKESNNVAARVVRINIPDKYFEKTFAQVGVSFFSKEEDFLIRVKDMAGFWRVLFNASYLSREYSEEVLKILSETSYDNGIVAGVPKNIVVAHKFGERVAEGLLLENEIFGINDVQVHDCGIVYFPGKPYIMCVMTRGTSFKNQEKAIAEVSAYFYKEVDKALAHKK